MKEVNFKQKLYTLSTSFIEDGGVVPYSSMRTFNNMRYFRILGIARDDKTFDGLDGVLNLVRGMTIEGIEIQFILLGDSYFTYVLVGTTDNYFDILKKMYVATYDGIEIADVNENFVKNKLRKCSYGGVVCGYPSISEEEITHLRSNISDTLNRGMAGDSWCFCISARAVQSQQTEELCQVIRDELQVVVPFVRKSISGQGLSENEQTEKIDYDAKEYQEKLECLLQKMNYARLDGGWCTSTFFATNSVYATQKMGGIIRSEIGGINSTPFNLKVVYFEQIDINRGIGLFQENLMHQQRSFIMEGMPEGEEPYAYFAKKYQFFLGSREMAKITILPKHETPGFYINKPMRFDCSPRRMEDEFEIGSIVHNGNVLANVPYALSINSLTKHCLINGITGGGKSNTSKYLLSTLYEEFQIPFLVIESAKQEYYELGRIIKNGSLAVFTLGYEGQNSVGYRINPFERIGSVSLQTHIDYLLAAFKASFEMVPPMPYILEASVYSVYKDYGWDVLADRNVKGKNDYPMLEDLYYKIEIVADEYGYGGELKSNIVSALQARIGSLRIGGKGAMLNTPWSYPVNQLLSIPTVLELDAIGDDDVKAFVISIIMVQLYEYRKSEMKNDTKKGLQHVLLIEEAHRLLKNVATTSEASTQAKAVEFFCNMLAEIRSYGQGIFVSDQMPTKLATDVLKNTNLKICHRIVTQEDRELLGTAMNMEEEQIEAISMFKTGYAAVYSEGDSSPMLVKLPLMKDKVSKTRNQILAESSKITKQFLPQVSIKKGNSIACSLCSNCKYKMKTEQLLEDEVIPDDFLEKVQDLFSKCDSVNAEILEALFEVLEKKYLRRPMLSDEKLCFINLYEGRFATSDAYLRKAFQELIGR